VQVRPLSRADYACASRVLRHLMYSHVDREELKELASDLLPVFVAQDVNFSMLEPTTRQPNRMAVWTRNIDAHILQGVLSQATPADPILLALRRDFPRVITLESLGRSERDRLLSSDSHAAYMGETGFRDFALTTLRTREDETLGRICFHRAKGVPPFDADRALILGALRPAFSQAVRRILSRQSRREGVETALFSACAEPLWMSDGFPFLWNSVDPSRLGPSAADATSLRKGGRLAIWVTRGILSHALGRPASLPTGSIRARFRNGRGTLAATLRSVLGWPFGRCEPVLEVRLDQRPAESRKPEVPATL
jgi:hypothetical protein